MFGLLLDAFFCATFQLGKVRPTSQKYVPVAFIFLIVFAAAWDIAYDSLAVLYWLVPAFLIGSALSQAHSMNLKSKGRETFIGFWILSGIFFAPVVAFLDSAELGFFNTFVQIMHMNFMWAAYRVWSDYQDKPHDFASSISPTTTRYLSEAAPPSPQKVPAGSSRTLVLASENILVTKFGDPIGSYLDKPIPSWICTDKGQYLDYAFSVNASYELAPGEVVITPGLLYRARNDGHH